MLYNVLVSWLDNVIRHIVISHCIKVYFIELLLKIKYVPTIKF